MFKKIGLLVGIILLVLVLVGIGFGAGFFSSLVLEKKNKPPLGLIEEVLGIIKHSYVAKVSLKKLEIEAVKGMIKALNDPYSRYLTPSEYKSFQEHTQGHFFGVGIEIGLKEGQIVVVSPIRGTPADKAGVKAGDKIIAIDGKSTKGMSLESAVKRIRGPKGTTVVLTISREKEAKPLEFRLVREKISFPNLSSKKLQGKLGYIYIHTFDGGVTSELKKALNKLLEKGVEAVVLDLRNNPGGSLDEAIGVASLFIEEGPIVKIKSRTGKIDTRYAEGQANEKIPLVVLVNEGSASASEIVAGALQDQERALLVGEKTFGKGSVQTLLRLSEGGLIITTNAYFTPKGRAVNKKGIKPDLIVPQGEEELLSQEDKQLKKAEEVLENSLPR